MKGLHYRARQHGLGAAASSRRYPANVGNMQGFKFVGGWKPPLLTAPLGLAGDSLCVGAAPLKAHNSPLGIVGW